MSEYPEHEKMSAVREKSQAIGEFLDWLKSDKGARLCVWQEAGDNGEPRYLDRRGEPTNARTSSTSGGREVGNDYNPVFESWPAQYALFWTNIQDLLAEFYEVDLKKIDAEKKAMLARLRELNAEKAGR